MSSDIVKVRCKGRRVQLLAVSHGSLVKRGHGYNAAGRRGMRIPELASICPMRIERCTTYQVLQGYLASLEGPRATPW